ncbi:hypothetical protein HY484_00880, partial [Candidatus Woesearchaeota archaeon]|nr:hypothetical protein [Candidatus Woesearchaeota archaeon]
DEEQNTVDASLDKLCALLNKFDYNNVGTKKEIKPYSNIVLENITGLSYLQDVLTAKANVELLEGHLIEADTAYNHASMIKKSLTRFDDFKNRKNVWNAVKTQNARELFGVNHLLSTAGIIDEKKNIETLCTELLQKTEEIFRYPSCKDKHEAFQFVVSYALEIPSRLYESGKIREDSAIVLRKKIINDTASVLKNLGQTDKTDYLPDLSQIVFSIIPGIGMLHVNEWKDCVSKDWFVPEGVSDEKIYAVVIREGHRLMSGDGNSAHYVGSTNPAIISRGIAIISTGASVVVPQLLKSHSSRAPETISQPDNPTVPPPVGGGGTTGHGVGN